MGGAEINGLSAALMDRQITALHLVHQSIGLTGWEKLSWGGVTPNVDCRFKSFWAVESTFIFAEKL